MKKFLQVLVLALVLIPTTNVLAADDEDKQFYKGVRVGWQQSNFSKGDYDDLSAFYVGFFGTKKLGAGKLLSMYSGLEYFQSGASNNADNQIKLGYISIPINLRVQLGPLYAFGGFNPSFKVYESVKSAGIEVKDLVDINGFDIGGQVGLGAKILFLGVEIKYNQGLTSVFKDTNNDSVTSHHLQAGLCVYF